MIVVEGKKAIHIAAMAWLVEESRELAWAEKHVIHNPAYAWVLGKYVGTGTANDNGHIFDATELAEARQSLVHAPMNMLHRPQAIMGVFVANEVIWPTEASPTTSASLAYGQQAETEPYLEALAAFYRYYFPDEYDDIKKAHDAGSLAWSMECVPETVTCASNDGCGKTFEYQGRQSPTYCAHLNEPGGAKRMGKPHFTAGALVVPPARPAWRSANVTELSSYVRQELEAAESLHTQGKAELPHLDTTAWEGLMGEFLTIVAKSDAREDRRTKQHAWRPVQPGQGNSPCKMCGKKKGDPVHPNTPDTAKATRIGHEVAREFTEDRRKQLAKEGKARRDGSFPIVTASDLRNAVQAIGRAKDPAAAKAHIIRRAKALGLTNLLPKDWQ